MTGLYFLDGKQTQDHNLTFQSARLRAVQFHDKDTFVDDRDVDSVSVYANTMRELGLLMVVIGNLDAN